jgi:hypothetical protein
MNLTKFDYFDYEPAEGEEETTLTDTALQLIKESIENQFKNPIGYAKVDFVSQFIQRYRLTLTEISDDFDDDENTQTKNMHTSFISFMERTLKEKLNIGIVDLEDMSEEDQEQMIHYLYRFFIININQNMFNYVYHYIKEHLSEIVATLPDIKTVSSRRMEEVVDNPDIIKVCTWMSKVIEIALTDENIFVDDFFALCRSKEYDLEREFIIEKYDNDEVTGNFVEPYRKMLPEPTLIELETEIIGKLTKKYRKEKVAEPEVPAENEEAKS